MPSAVPPAWDSLARRVSRRVNFAAWLDRFLPLLTGFLLLAAATLIGLRALHWPLSAWTFGLLAGPPVLALIALLRARPRFWTAADAWLRRGPT